MGRDFETMEKKYLLTFALLAVPGSGLPDISLNPRNNLTRNPKTFSLFSIVQFPNPECVAGSSSTTKGTCLTTSECTDKGGAADGDCAAGFGVGLVWFLFFSCLPSLPCLFFCCPIRFLVA